MFLDIIQTSPLYRSRDLGLAELLVAALTLGREVDVGGVKGLDVSVFVSHDRGVDTVADLALLEGC